MNTICDHCSELKQTSNYKAERKDGSGVYIHLCDECLNEYITLPKSKVFYTLKGDVKNVTLDLSSPNVASQHNQVLYGNNNAKKSFVYVHDKGVWTNIVKIMCFVFAGLLVIAGGIVGAVLLGGTSDELIMGLGGFILGAIVGGIIGMMNVAVLMMFVEISQNLATLVRKSNDR